MLKAVKIGNVDIPFPVGLAPLAGISDKTFRAICMEHGAGFVCTEMVSAKAIVYKNKNTYALLSRNEGEHPGAVQLFGSDPAALSAACEMIRDIPFDIVDLNMGCPVPKVVKNGEGSALMTDLKAAEKAILALVRSAGKPVTVKIRAGFDKDHINAVETAKMAEACGVSAITVHGRTREQYYSGKADLDIIRQVKQAVHVPVFGNGDICDGPSAARMLSETGCDGLLVGRAAMGNPWIFDQIRIFLETGDEPEKPAQDEIFEMIINHAERLAEANGEHMAIRQMRTHAACYLKGFRCAARLRGQINNVEDLASLKALFS
jgi:tRNA-dihydrouridine synthase B